MNNKLIDKFRRILSTRSSENFANYLRSKGISIGENFVAFGIKTIRIDTTRPSLISIGDNVSINSNFTLLTHDFVSGVFRILYNDFVPSSGAVRIGNNVRFGVNCTVLKGVTIGDNCFIAAGAMVTKDIPANSIAGGVPAKVICSIESYYEKRKKLCVEEAFAYARSIQERFGRKPEPADFCEEFPLFVDAHNIDDYPEIPIKKQLLNEIIYQNWLKNHKALFNSFDDFVDAALSNRPNI